MFSSACLTLNDSLFVPQLVYEPEYSRSQEAPQRQIQLGPEVVVGLSLQDEKTQDLKDLFDQLNSSSTPGGLGQKDELLEGGGQQRDGQERLCK